MASNILPLPLRRSHPISLSTAIKQYISNKYDQRPEMFAEDLLIIDRLRTDAINVQEPHISGISRLVTYAAQLKWLGGKFPIDVGVDFSWYPALGFNTSRPISQNNLRFELANILFNLAALYSQLAVSLNSTTPENLKTACKYLCNAAGVLVHLRTDILPDLRSSPPEDMDEMTLRSLEELLLAQAQECFWQKAVKDGLKDASIARLAAKVSDLYANAGDYGIKSDTINTEWIHHMTAKHHHFAAAAQYRQSRDCLEKQKYGEEIARLRDSAMCVNEALKGAKWINRVVLGDLNGLKARVTEDLKRAERDNDMIYLFPVPPKSELKLLDRASMVAAKAPVEVTDALSMIGEGLPLGRPLFAKLVPYAVHVAASIYAERRDRLVQQEITGGVEEMTAKLRGLLQSLNLPGSLQALEKPLGLPPSLLSHAEEVRQQDGLNRLRLSLKDIAKLKENDKTIYTEGVELLMAERDEDDRARAKYGTDRWTREPSEVAGKKLYTQAKDIEGYLASAANSDKLVEEKLRETEKVLRLLTGTNRDIEAFVPSSRKATITEAVEREAGRLRGCLNEVSRLESRRRRRVEALREKARGDSIHAALLKETGRLEREFPMQRIEASQFEDLFAERLKQYDEDRKLLLEEEEKAQSAIAEQLREANRAFVNARRGDSSTKEREKALQELENGYVRYKEIIGNVEVGRKFYNDLAKLVGRFREDCRGFVSGRRVEAGELETDITNTTAMASLSISQKQKQHPFSPQAAPTTSPPAAIAAANTAIQHEQQQKQQHQHHQSPPFHHHRQPIQTPRQKSPLKSTRSWTPSHTPFTPSTTTSSSPSSQQPAAPAPSPAPQPQPQPPESPLAAPQPTRTSIIPPPSTMPVGGMWSPEMGIKFGPPASHAQMNVPGQAEEGQQMQMPMPGRWDASLGVRFS
ncbi:pH-response regulator protein palA/RIM20 [Blastomyces dermatitidis ER-3]|uniref:PH-response regulator protein palA/RIM20 n=1 Tax=Ajellomyces dermatitidis (strain ER-3 / ATCC MYA-2586) TaxID=559297 RepID=A0ABP2ELU8_AJEDR|nr:pH-response regulator protein palA/RIM20 [Blastomyces dermatitidis ER-3]EEQ83574.2 pH-response regulator protein palA/RIM20 [Blastomyces dermatitidis ER-3]